LNYQEAMNSIGSLSSEDRERSLGQFLNFLARDIHQNPQHLQSISCNLVNQIRSLVAHADIDLNMPLLDEDE
jgi:antitoxin PrlF